MKNLFAWLLTLCAFVCAKNYIPGKWEPLAHPPLWTSQGADQNGTEYSLCVSTGGASNPLLLTDGRIMVQNNGFWNTNDIYALTPDEWGSYVNGTWSQLASLPNLYNTTIPYIPNAFCSAVLADGRVIFAGGEYLGADFEFLLTNGVAIYDPVNDTWTAIAPPSFFVDLYPPRAEFAPNPIGDAACVVLSDGTFMIENKMSKQSAYLDLETYEWIDTHGDKTKRFWNDEEGLTLLHDGTVLAVNCYTEAKFLPDNFSYPSDPTHSEIWDPKKGKWLDAGSTIVSLTDPVLYETGPAVLLPNGKVFAVGSTGNTSFYDTKKKKWHQGPTLPNSPYTGLPMVVQDGPAAVMPNGNVLFTATTGNVTEDGYNEGPAAFLELQGETIYIAPNLPHASNTMNPSILAINPGWLYLLMGLPTGQVIAVDNSLDVRIYTPGDRSFNPQWRPVVIDSPAVVQPGGKNYKISGKLFNGMTQGAGYGDDYLGATNYPLVRIINVQTGHVFYCRTHDHSYMGVAAVQKTVYTYFDVPETLEHGKSYLVVVANGIPSKRVQIIVGSDQGGSWEGYLTGQGVGDEEGEAEEGAATRSQRSSGKVKTISDGTETKKARQSFVDLRAKRCLESNN